MFEAILLDFDGTLVDFVESDIQSLKLLHAHTGSAINFDDFLETSIDEIMNFHNLVAAHKIDPLFMHTFRLKNTFARHNIGWRDDYVNFYRKNLVNLCVPLDGVKQFLNKAKKKVKTGLISNAYDGLEQRERISRAGIYDYFDVIVIAGETGIYKPDPAIFSYALNRLNVAPEKALYIGDSVTYDILGAKSAGMRTVLFCQHSKKDNPLADYIVQGIDGLDLLMDQIL